MIQRKPYLLFLITASLLLCYSFSAEDSKTLDINIGDTYYVIGEKFLIALLVVVTGVLGLLYGILDGIKLSLKARWSVIHIYGSILLLFPLLYFAYQSAVIEMVVKSDALLQRPDYNYRLFVVLMLFALLQVLFLMNIFAAVSKRLRNGVAK